MQKSIITQGAQPNSAWLDLPSLATLEITSEDDLFPIDHALALIPTTGWRAAFPGPQTIRLLFHTPQHLRRVQIHIVDRAAERTQEFSLHAAQSNQPPTELRRQQFTFSPAGSTEELEDYTVDLPGTTLLELRIDPGRAHPAQHFATLTSLRLA